MAKRSQPDSGGERVTAKSRPMMNLIARTPSHVSSSTSVSPGKKSHGSQDPWSSMAKKEERSVRLDIGVDRLKASDYYHHEQSPQSSLPGHRRKGLSTTIVCLANTAPAQHRRSTTWWCRRWRRSVADWRSVVIQQFGGVVDGAPVHRWAVLWRSDEAQKWKHDWAENTRTSTRQVVRVNPHSSYRFCFLSTLQDVCGITTTNSSRLRHVSFVRIQQSSPLSSAADDIEAGRLLPQETSDLKWLRETKWLQKQEHVTKKRKTRTQLRLPSLSEKVTRHHLT